MGPNNKETNRINNGVIGVVASHLFDNLENVIFMS